MTNKTIGKYGEEIAKNFLIKNKYKILQTNFHYSKIAEIDIIAVKNNILHFIEVKTRTQINTGNPLEAITKAKLKSILLAAKSYIQNTDKRYDGYKIDAIGIVLDKNAIKDIVLIEDVSL